jgi:hypothetical protein
MPVVVGNLSFVEGFPSLHLPPIACLALLYLLKGTEEVGSVAGAHNIWSEHVVDGRVKDCSS